MVKKPLCSIIGLAALALSGAAAFQTEAQAKPAPRANNQATVFRCVRSGGAHATVAERGGRRSRPMILWQSEVFGPEYTPEVRCNNVSQRLTRAVAQNGGSLRNLLLTTGRVSGQTVICYINSGASSCNGNNMLFTLNPENARDPGAALAKILRFGAGASGGPLLQDADGGEESASVDSVDMEAAVEEAFSGPGLQSADEEGSSVSPNPSESTEDAQNSPATEPSETPASETGGNQGGSW